MSEKKFTDMSIAELVGTGKEFSAILMLADLGSCVRARDALALLEGAEKLATEAEKKLKESSLLVNTWYEKGGFRERSEDLMLRVSGALMELKGLTVKGKRKPGCNAYIDKVLNLEIEQATEMLDAVIEAKKESKDQPPGEP